MELVEVPKGTEMGLGGPGPLWGVARALFWKDVDSLKATTEEEGVAFL